ncbi:MAG TPA: adenine deaminase [Flavitalea sp.]|nr:adenine deaminase [Flavitalea sp.]
MNAFSINGNIADIPGKKFFTGTIHVKNGRIDSIQKNSDGIDSDLKFILPGFIDSHVHIESSMLVPSEFARLAVVHGTVSTVSDPHEIANVCGAAGVEYMIDNARNVNFKFYFGAPSCVPATVFETAGDTIDSEGVQQLLERSEIKYLSEMMNFPGVIHDDPEVMKKIVFAHKLSKPVDGHAPGLRGDALIKYVSAGISTDHECFSKEEALEKLKIGMKIIIREGSAAKNFDALISLLNDYPDMIMFCSDDKHPDSLVQGHINDLCKRAINKGIDVFHVLRAACWNPVLHYHLETGLLREGDAADFILVDDVKAFHVYKTFINGICVAENSKTNIPSSHNRIINQFNCKKISSDSLKCPVEKYLIDNKLPAIEALDGQLITNQLSVVANIENGNIVCDVTNDILKIVVVNRYNNSAPAISFVKNFGCKSGAIASSVAHDSHNIIAVGTDDNSIAHSINLVIENKGGITCVSSSEEIVLALPVAGLMSDNDGYRVADAYTAIDRMAKSIGCTLSAPFMTLSFMALLVIPSLKLSDKGLFDGARFKFMY